MQPISRRAALTLGSLGLASTAVGIAGLARLGTSSPGGGAPGTGFREPEVLRSAGGTLSVRLEAAVGRHDLAGVRATTPGYNGGVPGPTLRLRPGDRLQVELVNRLEQPTNLHVHGMYVSPEGNSDNVFVAVQPGESFAYEYQLPEDHPPGLYWYHPHHHHRVADQLFGGLYGAIVVEDAADFPAARERVLVVADTSLDAAGRVLAPSLMQQMMGREGDLVLVNGQLAPALTARPGERERWRIVNACSSRFLALQLEGAAGVVLGRDSGRLAEPRALVDPGGDGGLVLAPGNRADLAVTAGTGRGVLRALPYDRGTMGPMMGGGRAAGGRDPVVLATLEVAGERAGTAAALPRPPAPRDLRSAEVARTRLLTFAMGMGAMMGGGGGMRFTIDQREYDPARTDQQVALGTVEEWTIRNTSPMDHPFHLHVWPMQVLSQGGRTVEEPTWLDVVNVPAESETTVRVAFETFGGRTVYHCHILDHEDRGMMGVVEAR